MWVLRFQNVLKVWFPMVWVCKFQLVPVHVRSRTAPLLYDRCLGKSAPWMGILFY